MNELAEIKTRVEKLYKAGAPIRIDVTFTHPKIRLRGVEVMIKGVYPNFFRVETSEGGALRTYTCNFSDLLIGRIRIVEE